MSSLLGRVGGWLVAPETGERAAAPVPVPARAAARRQPEVAVLAAPGDAVVLAAALALRLTRGRAVVGVWPGETRRAFGVPPTPAARALAGSLSARGLAAAAAGRLVTVALADAAEAARLGGAVTDAPVVLALGGPRAAGWEPVLAEQDFVVVHARRAALAALAAAGLDGRALVLDGMPGAVAGALARRGLALPGALDALTPAVEVVR